MKRLLLAGVWICTWTILALAEPTIGQSYRLSLSDVDGNDLSTADGRFNVIVLSSKANSDKARIVGDRIPDFCLANPNYRMVTVVVFDQNHGTTVRAVLRAAIRHRVASEAQRLQKRYEEHQISRNARHDVFAVADFDGAIAAKLELKPDARLFHVFVFGKNGELLKQWSDVPSEGELATALKQN